MAIKKFVKNITIWEKVSNEELSNVYKAIDKCAKVWIIKKKTAARKKSRVARLYNGIGNTPTAKVEKKVEKKEEKVSE